MRLVLSCGRIVRLAARAGAESAVQARGFAESGSSGWTFPARLVGGFRQYESH
jgi:hypothetical protein